MPATLRLVCSDHKEKQKDGTIKRGIGLDMTHFVWNDRGVDATCRSQRIVQSEKLLLLFGEYILKGQCLRVTGGESGTWEQRIVDMVGNARTKPGYFLRRVMGGSVEAILKKEGDQCWVGDDLPPDVIEVTYNDQPMTGHALQKLCNRIRQGPPPPEKQGDASVDFGRQCYLSLVLEGALTQILQELSFAQGAHTAAGRRQKYDRMRLYLLHPETASFHMIVELGGVRGNPRRIHIPWSDVLSQVLIRECRRRRCLRLTKKADSPEVTIHAPKANDPNNDEELNYRGMISHDDPSLERERVLEWLDVPLIYRDTLVGKITIDNLWSWKQADEKSNRQEWEKACKLNCCDKDLSKGAGKAAEEIWRFQNGHSEAAVGNLKSDVCEQAVKRALLDDKLRTLLTQLRWDPRLQRREETQFSRFRLYLTIKKHVTLFGRLAEALEGRPPANQDGFWGQVELGGFNRVFSEFRIPDRRESINDDDPTAICFGIKDKVDQNAKIIHDAFRKGLPIVFSKRVNKLSTETDVATGPTVFKDAKGEIVLIPVCPYQHQSQQDVDEFLHVPVLSRDDLQVIGKIEIDNKWNYDGRIPDFQEKSDQDQVDCLREYAELIAAIIAAADEAPNDDLCAALLEKLHPLAGVFL